MNVSASATWSGYVAAPKICATSASGYNAIGATSASRSLADTVAYCSCPARAGGEAVPLTATIGHTSNALKMAIRDGLRIFMKLCALAARFEGESFPRAGTSTPQTISSFRSTAYRAQLLLECGSPAAAFTASFTPPVQLPSQSSGPALHSSHLHTS